jgi:AcrR family transcriptional regulator
VFARRGFHAASVAEISEEAGLSTGAVYSNFAGKEELFLAAYDEYAAGRTEEIREAFAGVDGLAEKMRRGADQWMGRLATEAEVFLAQLEFGAQAARSPRLGQQFANREAAVPETIARLLADQAADEDVDLPLPPELLAVIVRALGNGLGLERLNAPELVSQELFGDFLAWLFAAIAAGTPSAQLRFRVPTGSPPRENSG